MNSNEQLSAEELSAFVDICKHPTVVESLAVATPQPQHLPGKQKRFFRLERHLPVVLKVNGNAMPAEAINIGLGGALLRGPFGVFIRGYLELPVGKKVEVEVELPKPKSVITLEGSVCWRKIKQGQVTGLGIRFFAHPVETIWAIIANIDQAIKDDLAAVD
ncbi:PilZ domain-containing protein [Desulfurivibrio dismutans]|uniref:PilZ domain-containing protein n=1 Tax=Desulfurivibrio dismutans TaxID=1398908 RepID=UPI0023D9E4AC|nr:PilZ domain-containing protein [Desulfurivibrio alkaliphilus]MDF1615222.1 PilZ domain-containing protein [Desulfurivibrio alkaliphilus]